MASDPWSYQMISAWPLSGDSCHGVLGQSEGVKIKEVIQIESYLGFLWEFIWQKMAGI